MAKLDAIQSKLDAKLDVAKLDARANCYPLQCGKIRCYPVKSKLYAKLKNDRAQNTSTSFGIRNNAMESCQTIVRVAEPPNNCESRRTLTVYYGARSAPKKLLGIFAPICGNFEGIYSRQKKDCYGKPPNTCESRQTLTVCYGARSAPKKILGIRAPIGCTFEGIYMQFPDRPDGSVPCTPYR